MTRYRVEWQKNGVITFEGHIDEFSDLEAYVEDLVFWDDPKTVEFDIFVEGEYGWEPKQ